MPETSCPRQAFYDYVRGRTEVIPPGHREDGMRAYRHLVLLGARQQLEARYPQLPQTLGEAGWTQLLQAYVRDSAWTSPFIGDLGDDFADHVARLAG